MVEEFLFANVRFAKEITTMKKQELYNQVKLEAALDPSNQAEIKPLVGSSKRQETFQDRISDSKNRRTREKRQGQRKRRKGKGKKIKGSTVGT